MGMPSRALTGIPDISKGSSAGGFNFGTAATFAGIGLGAFGQLRAGQESASALRYNASLMEQRERVIGQLSESETEIAQKSGRRLRGTQLAMAAKSGAEITSGTPLLLLAEQAGEMQRDIFEQRRTRMIQQQQAKEQARMLRYRAKKAKRRGIGSAIGTALGGAAGFLVGGPGGASVGASLGGQLGGAV
jgi:hypothetical protein